MTNRTHDDIRKAIKTGDWTVLSIIAIVQQLLAENEDLKTREDELEQTISELNAFDVPQEMVDLRIENTRLIDAEHSAVQRGNRLAKQVKLTNE